MLPRSMRSALFQVNLTIHHLLNNAKRYLQNNLYGSASVDGGCADNLCLLLVYDFTKRYPRELGHFVPDLRVPLPLLKGETKVSPFFVAGVMCYLSPKPPFCKGGLLIHSASSSTNLQFSMKLLEISILCATQRRNESFSFFLFCRLAAALLTFKLQADVSSKRISP